MPYIFYMFNYRLLHLGCRGINFASTSPRPPLTVLAVAWPGNCTDNVPSLLKQQQQLTIIILSHFRRETAVRNAKQLPHRHREETLALINSHRDKEQTASVE